MRGDYTGTISKTLEIEYEVIGTLTKFVPQTWDSPAEGGAIEDVSFRVLSFDGVPREKMTDGNVNFIERMLHERLGTEDRFLDRLHEELAEQAGDDDGPDPDMLREQREDRRLMDWERYGNRCEE